MASTQRDDSGDDGARGWTARVPLPSPAMAVALLALFVAMGGSAWAVTKVGTKQIRNNAVTTPKIKPGAVKASRLAAGSVTGSKIAAGAVTGPKLAVGSVGAANILPGSVGADTLADSAVTTGKIADAAVNSSKIAASAVDWWQIADGAVEGSKILAGAVSSSKIADQTIGSNKLSYSYVDGPEEAMAVGQSATATAICPAGKIAISMGYIANSPAVNVYAAYLSTSQAVVFANNPNDSPVPNATIQAKAICL